MSKMLSGKAQFSMVRAQNRLGGSSPLGLKIGAILGFLLMSGCGYETDCETKIVSRIDSCYWDHITSCNNCMTTFQGGLYTTMCNPGIGQAVRVCW